ncbi:hypothetical protein [Granulicella sp. L56]|uniref:hypothetical protein n=1 Tax=Granulicella sp. L56 TaxID=1747222 RepID=UPI00131EC638|nr:hypothetical protein [Granulicella sp. L56]MDW5266949.1 hypothetical protein [Edaphobacter sp.]
MWRLAKADGEGRIILILSGRIGTEQLAELRRTVEMEAARQEVALDIENLRLVDREVVAYLAQCEMSGVRIQNCPMYIREWIASSGRESLPTTWDDTCRDQ